MKVPILIFRLNERKIKQNYPTDELEDDLMNFDWDKQNKNMAITEEDSEESVEMESLDDLLGDFLSRMNK